MVSGKAYRPSRPSGLASYQLKETSLFLFPVLVRTNAAPSEEAREPLRKGPWPAAGKETLGGRRRAPPGGGGVGVAWLVTLGGLSEGGLAASGAGGPEGPSQMSASCPRQPEGSQPSSPWRQVSLTSRRMFACVCGPPLPEWPLGWDVSVPVTGVGPALRTRNTWHTVGARQILLLGANAPPFYS